MSEPLAVELSIVIVNRNAGSYLRQCVASVVNTLSQPTNFEVIVVDNASSDGSLRHIEALSDGLVVVRNESNVGFSRANNQGVHISRGRCVLFLNPDTVVSSGSISTVLAYLEDHRDVGAATAAVQLPSGKPDDAAHRGFPTPWNALWHFSGVSRIFPRSKLLAGYTRGWEDLSAIHDVECVAGAFMLVRRDAGTQVGWWDEDYFFYGEDVDFCYRLRHAGWRITYVPSPAVLHYKGLSSGIRRESRRVTLANRAERQRATKARFDAMRIFYRKHYTGRYPAPVRSAVMAAVWLKEQYALLLIDRAERRSGVRK